MRRNPFIFAVIAMVALFGSACAAAIGGPMQTTVAVGYDEFAQNRNISKEITIAKNAELVVKLASNPSTGFNWTPAAIGTPSVLAQVDSKYVAPSGNAVGAAGTQVLTFKASEKGTTTVKMDYSRPWEGGEKAEWTFQLRVTVQ